jgi:hypothetical protein
MIENIVQLGSFEVESGKINITDPCYKPGTWCGSFDLPAKNGKWLAHINYADYGEWGIRAASLTVFHEELSGSRWVAVSKDNVDCGVDSGQLGVFDSKYYQNNEIGKEQLEKANLSKDMIESHRSCGNEDWYIMCCDKTLDDNKSAAGIIPFGVVSSTGFGDGNYDVALSKDDEGNIVQVVATFIEAGFFDDNNEEEYDDDDPFADE